MCVRDSTHEPSPRVRQLHDGAGARRPILPRRLRSLRLAPAVLRCRAPDVVERAAEDALDLCETLPALQLGERRRGGRLGGLLRRDGLAEALRVQQFVEEVVEPLRRM